MTQPYWEPLAAAPVNTNQELAYAERTAAYTCAQGAETSICVTAPSINLDGLTKICVEAYFVGTADSGGNVIYVTMFDNGVNIGRMSTNVRSGMPAKRYLTPAAGAHVYAFSVWSGYSDYAMNIGAGGSTIYAPAFIRVSKAA